MDRAVPLAVELEDDEVRHADVLPASSLTRREAAHFPFVHKHTPMPDLMEKAFGFLTTIVDVGISRVE